MVTMYLLAMMVSQEVVVSFGLFQFCSEDANMFYVVEVKLAVVLF